MDIPFSFEMMGLPSDIFKTPAYTDPNDPNILAENLMREHTRMTIRYVIAAFFALKGAREQDRAHWEGIPDMLVGQLLDQIDDWFSKIVQIAMVAGRAHYHNRNVRKAYQAFKKEITKHIQAAGKLATGVYTENEKMANEAATFLLGKNTVMMSIVLGWITGQPRDAFKNAWTAHVECTAKYIKSAMVSPKKFMDDAADCMEVSIKVGEMMDRFYDDALQYHRRTLYSEERMHVEGSKVQNEISYGYRMAPHFDSSGKEMSLNNLYGWMT